MPREQNDPNAPPVTSSCHCGSIRVTFPKPTQPLNECHCSICYRYGCMWAYYTQDQVKVEINEGCTRDTKTGKTILPGESAPLSTSPNASGYASGEKLMREGVEKMRISHDDDKSKEDAGVDVDYGRGDGCGSYLWGDKNVDFCRCAHCGCVTHWLPSEKLGGKRIGVNCRMLERDVLDSLEKKVTPNWD